MAEMNLRGWIASQSPERFRFRPSRRATISIITQPADKQTLSAQKSVIARISGKEVVREKWAGWHKPG